LHYPNKKKKSNFVSLVDVRPHTDEEVKVKLFTPGKVLCIRLLLKLKYIYLKPLKKNERRHHRNDNKHVLIAWIKDYKTNGATKLAHYNHKKY
jgi:hypothetical protein